MRALLARLTNPLRTIDADPDDLVHEAYELLRQAEKNEGNWPAMTAYTGKATAKIQLAQYLKEHRG
ncbi:hypothetical protein [Streptomyces venezuelae]|uniref:hypothetical protein n=1 Tax=Streptomyces venezuelae TaxID=54571 RepID=UPI003447A7B8